MRNDGDWSTGQITWLQLLRSLPHAAFGRHCGKLRNVDVDIQSHTYGKFTHYAFYPQFHSTFPVYQQPCTTAKLHIFTSMHLLQWLPNMAADIMYSCIWGWSPGLCSRRFTAAVHTYHYRSSPTSPADFNIAEMIETAIHHGCIEASLPADLPLQTVTQPLLSPCLYLCQLYLQPARKVHTLHQLNSTENYGRRYLTPLSPHRNYILS